jgi:uncharacterized protein (DUF952 family)
MVYKILRPVEWADLQAKGAFAGAPVDLADGFVHLSFAHQVAGTLDKHFAAEPDGLILVALAADALGADLVAEPSRGGQLFPHLYAPLPLAAVRQHWRLVRDGGAFRLPDLAL